MDEQTRHRFKILTGLRKELRDVKEENNKLKKRSAASYAADVEERINTQLFAFAEIVKTHETQLSKLKSEVRERYHHLNDLAKIIFSKLNIEYPENPALKKPYEIYMSKEALVKAVLASPNTPKRPKRK